MRVILHAPTADALHRARSNARNLDTPANIRAVPAAVESLALLQAEGWTYIRA
jgi:intracellular sulfur oxidation DsrE/DsrF family protein